MSEGLSPTADNAAAIAAAMDKLEADQPVKSYEALAEKLRQAIDQGDAPWMRSWEPGTTDLPYNYTNGAIYHGNTLLSLMGENSPDPRWMTRSQAQKHGLEVKAGELSNCVGGYFVSFTKYEYRLDAEGNRLRDADGRWIKDPVHLAEPVVSSFKLYNASQIDGVLPYIPERPSPEKLAKTYAEIEALAKSMGVKITHKKMQGKETPHYEASADKVVMPRKLDYRDIRAYYSDLLHGLAHATAASSRMGRDVGGFRDGHHDPKKVTRDQAFEELSVQIAAMMMVRRFNIGHYEHPTNGAYVKGWSKMLKDDPRVVLRLSQRAEDIAFYCLSHEHDRTQSIDAVNRQILERNRKYEAPKPVAASRLREATAAGVKHAALPLPTAVVVEQDTRGKEALSRQDIADNAAIKRYRAMEKEQALSVWRQTTDIDPTINGLPPIAKRLKVTGEDRSKDRIVFPMVGADGRIASIMQAMGPWARARMPSNMSNQDVFCPFAGMRSLVGDGRTPPPKEVKPVVVVDNAVTGEMFWMAGAHVVMAASSASMGRAAEALRAVRPDIPIVFAMERGDRVNEPEVPVQGNGLPFENATAIRPMRGAASFQKEGVIPHEQVPSLTMVLQAAFGSLLKSQATERLEEVRERVLETERQLELERTQDNNRKRARGRNR
jgi:antirestriction protein ArdC